MRVLFYAICIAGMWGVFSLQSAIISSDNFGLGYALGSIVTALMLWLGEKVEQSRNH